MHQALIGWVDKTLYVALDTSMLWNTFCLVRLLVIYRGRAVPLVWCVIEHPSAAVAYEEYQGCWRRLDGACCLQRGVSG